MTDSTDDAEDAAAKYEVAIEKARTTWTGKDGTKYTITEMTTSHIKNCIAMLERYHLNEEIGLLCAIDSVNGEQAGYHLEDAYESLIEEGHDDIAQVYIDTFNAELERRGEKL